MRFKAKPRSRVVSAVLMLCVSGLGLLSRSRAIPLPHFILAYAGDLLWALLVFLGLGFLYPNLSMTRVALGAAAFSLFIELSQLYHIPWLDALRQKRIASLILGQGFRWSDLVCYAVGIALGTVWEAARVPQRNDPDLQA